MTGVDDRPDAPAPNSSRPHSWSPPAPPSPPVTSGPPASPAGEPDGRSGTARFRPAGAAETLRANRSWWDGVAEDYYAEHGEFLGDDRFVWGPEGLDEAEAGCSVR